jgi:hypothetical protein
MSDSRRTYRAIRTKLVQLRGYPSGVALQRTGVLAAFIAGIVSSKSTHQRKVAERSGLESKVESRIKQLTRWYKNQNISYELDYLPYLDHILAEFATGHVVLAIDGSEVGRGCMTLMISLIYEKRSIPLVWTVFQRPKGHASSAEHIEIVKRVVQVLPAELTITFLGDGEFDSVQLQEFIQATAKWDYVCRTAKNTIIDAEGDRLRLDEIVVMSDVCIAIPDVLFTEQAFGPVHIVIVWDKEQHEPIYLVTNLEIAEEARYWYRLRMRIETFFSDQKSRGFNIHKNHVSDPKRLARILIAACLAYIWIIYLGVQAHRTNMVAVIHRTDRCDLGLFQLGLALLQHFLNEELDIDIGLTLHKIKPLPA